MTAIVCVAIATVGLYACVYTIMEVWDDEKRRQHFRWESEHDKSNDT